MGLLLPLVLISCSRDLNDCERKEVTSICVPLCRKLGSRTYRVDIGMNGFKQIFNYKCLCYPPEGPANPIRIIISKRDIEGLCKSGKPIIKKPVEYN